MLSALRFVGAVLILLSLFFIYQRSQQAKEAYRLEQEYEAVFQGMNDEIDRQGHASEHVRANWLDLGNEKARAAHKAWMQGVCASTSMAIGAFALMWSCIQRRPLADAEDQTTG